MQGHVTLQEMIVGVFLWNVTWIRIILMTVIVVYIHVQS